MPTTKTRTRTTPRTTAAQGRTARSTRITDLSEQLKAFAESLNPAEQAAYAARFDYYSPRNAMLIVMQDPNATVVRAFKAWLAEGRCVRKGERSRIAILAPAGQTGGQHDDPTTGVQPGEMTAEKVRRFFRLVPVFDISQTRSLDEADEAADAAAAGPLTEAEEDALGEDL